MKLKKEFGAILLLSAVMLSGCGSDNIQKQDSNEVSATQQDTKDAKLIGTSEDKKVKLYEEANDIKLDVNGKVKNFNWENPGNTGTDPQVFYTDVTEDGGEEAVVIINTGRGTELDIFDIHVVDEDLHEIKVPDYKEITENYIKSNVVKKDANTLGITAKVQGTEHNLDFDFADLGFDPQPDLKLKQNELAFGGTTIYFLEHQKIKLNLIGSVAISATPTYVVDFIITYAFDNTKNEFIVDQIDVKPVEYKKG